MTTETDTLADALPAPAQLSEDIDMYIKLRDKKRMMDERFKEMLAPINNELIAIENRVLESLDAQGIGSASSKTTKSTAYVSIKSSVTAPDWDEFLDWVRANEQWHMINRTPNKTAVIEYSDDTKDLPPGVRLKTFRTANFRK